MNVGTGKTDLKLNQPRDISNTSQLTERERERERERKGRKGRYRLNVVGAD